MKILICGAVALVVLAAAGCGGSGQPSNSAATFVRQVTTEFSRGQSGPLWDQLLPADQRVVTRARFVACQANEGWDLKNINVLQTYSDPVNVGTKTIPATAVSVRVTSESGVTTATMHAVSSSGHWHWILQPSDRSAYAAGRCPVSGR
jgi:hypothetical protein